ncbi:hypothetical protein ACF9IK_04795 [Kitasatospora hibisci]|uniref:hypothetical protein n=1 Tax=Kitasatospora hibisci TaxID=3369522 RepID=UPI0037551565
MSRAAGRMQMNRPCNVLAGVMMHAAARRDQGLALSDLEQGLVDVLGVFVSDEEISAAGRIWRKASPSTSAQLFPAVVTALPVEIAYTFDDLAADLPGLAAEILAQPNVNIVDVSTLESDGSVDTAEDVDAMTEYGGSAVTVLTGPALDESARAALTGVNIVPKSFSCVRSTPGEAGNDEIYWVCGAGSDTEQQTEYRSAVFEGLRTGHVRDFPAGQPLFLGSLHESLILNIECWEEDNGAIFEELRKQLWKISQQAAASAKSIIDHGESSDAALAAVVAVVAALLTWILGWFTNDDDLVGERSIAITAKALGYAASRLTDGPSMPNTPGFTWDFSSSEGHYRLVTAADAAPDQNMYLRTWSADRGWSGESFVPGVRVGTGAPAVGVLNGTLHYLHREWNAEEFTNAVQWRTYDGTTWSDYTKTPFASETPLSNLATMGDHLYLCYIPWPHGGDKLKLDRTDGTRWNGLASPMGGSREHAPGLAVMDNTLYCAYQRGDGIYCHPYRSDGTWGDWIPAIPYSKDAKGHVLAAYLGKLHCVFRDSADGLIWASYDGSVWTTHGAIAGARSPATPALAVRVNMMYCVHRGMDGVNWWSKFNGARWNTWEKLPGNDPIDSPVMTVFRDQLHLFYRR